MIDSLISKGVIPDFLIRRGIRNYIGKRIQNDIGSTPEEKNRKKEEFIKLMKESPIAIDTDKANDQHYTVPTDFFLEVLGEELKYSCSHWDTSQKVR